MEMVKGGMDLGDDDAEAADENANAPLMLPRPPKNAARIAQQVSKVPPRIGANIFMLD
jgi:hypothetical protein